MEIKVSVSFILQGRVLLNKKEVELLERENKNCYDTFSMTVEDRKNKDSSVIEVSTRKYVPAVQNLNISDEGYFYMTGREVPYWAKTSLWNNISAKQRLELHLQRICESLGGVSYTYTVFED